MLQALKELYGGDEWEVNRMHGPQTELESVLIPISYERVPSINVADLVYRDNPFLKLIKE
jgi:hypothetical protein